MLNNSDLKYIIKRVIIGLLIFFIISFVNKCDVKADVILGGTTLSSSNYKILPSGNQTLSFRQNKLYSLSEVPEYFLVTLCADNQRIQNWYINNNTLRTINFFDTNYKCMFPNSSYTGGHVVYVYGTYDIATACGSSTTTCLPQGSVTFYNPSQKSFALLSYEESINSISIDYASQSIISNNEQLISKQNEMITKQNEMITKQQATNDKLNQITQQNINTYNMQKAESDETQQKLDSLKGSTDKIDNTINNDDVSGANSQVDSLLQNDAFNESSGIQSIINAPLNFINGLNNSCTPIQLTIPYINTPLSIPCIKQELTNRIPSVVPILSTSINGFIIYRILLDIVYIIKSAKNPDDDRIEVLDL